MELNATARLFEIVHSVTFSFTMHPNELERAVMERDVITFYYKDERQASYEVILGGLTAYNGGAVPDANVLISELNEFIATADGQTTVDEVIDTVDVDSSSTSVEDGGITKLQTTNISSEGLLSGILKELKKINFHMSIITDTIINDTEVE